jgi:hypothetical protein
VSAYRPIRNIRTYEAILSVDVLYAKYGPASGARKKFLLHGHHGFPKLQQVGVQVFHVF